MKEGWQQGPFLAQIHVVFECDQILFSRLNCHLMESAQIKKPLLQLLVGNCGGGRGFVRFIKVGHSVENF